MASVTVKPVTDSFDPDDQSNYSPSQMTYLNRATDDQSNYSPSQMTYLNRTTTSALTPRHHRSRSHSRYRGRRIQHSRGRRHRIRCPPSPLSPTATTCRFRGRGRRIRKLPPLAPEVQNIADR
uniref:Uncharacterized protein n=1 Tax=Oryza sativa subsp. japonica TaxID=39947 RepID=Q6YZ81_ORYSJ|nr:hypothetical protein [Oryza sativa Japonica Group]